MSAPLSERIASLDWPVMHQLLDEHGYAKLPALLSPEECERIAGDFEDERLFRSSVHMARYRFGIGDYRYYASPLPDWLQQLRESLYPELARAANRWLVQLGHEPAYPALLADFIEQCRREGQVRPTPLLLKYDAGGYNCLHQDMYGTVFFPFQVLFMLSERGTGYTGGEFLLVEQRPRAQSRGHALTLERGEAVIFPTQFRPVHGSRGYYKATLRHGVSTVTTGTRYSLGIIFHDAK